MKFIRKNRHLLPVTLGCIIMLVAVSALAVTTSGVSWALYLLLFLCPVMHLLMHRGIHGRSGHAKTTRAQVPIPVNEAVVKKTDRGY